MGLFQKSVLEKYLKQLDDNIVKEAYKKFQDYFHNPDRQANIRAAKEEQFQEGFLRELFVKILGYTINPEPDYNLTSEFKNEKGAKKADGAILIDGNAIGVIELKGTDTKDLDKINEQAFSYKNNQSICVYVITSNFEKLRFFIRNAVDHEEFNLFELTEDEFKLLWVCLQKDNLLAGIPEKIKEESLLEEEKVTKRLYADYSAFKRELWHDMVQRNPEYDELLLFKKSQKLLDRFLFILFSEDKGLLPPNSISEIVNQWQDLKDLDEYRPLYDRYKKYFWYMNEGFKGKKYEIHAYNGGLFCADEVLDSVVIDDEVLRKHTMKLTEYDFNSEVDVNILGHIFEHSLNEIENVRAQLEGVEVDKNKSKRKKDGIFYTPRYITKYIVDNTVGKLCEEKKAVLGITDERFREAGKRTRKGIKDLEDFREWLLSLTICDPACGSGAFLNQALEFLINEHTWLDELIAAYHGSKIVFPDVEKHILENNLYGVDINEESIEIAKLSLWLRTAQQGRKLTALSDNIKCGNSLIDDPEVAGDKAFKWEDEFSSVFEKGGFDVVIGNPPYGAKLEASSKEFINKKYITFNKNYDVYSAFIQAAFEIIKNNGLWGFINPVSWQSNENYLDLRNFLKENGELKIAIKLPYNVFEDAYVDTGIYIACKGVSKDYYSRVYDFPVHTSNTASTLQFLQLKKLPSNYWTTLNSLKIVLNPSFYELLPKLNNDTIPLKDITDSVRGILPNKEDIVEIQQPNSKPYFVGNLYRYLLHENFNQVIYSENLKEKPKEYGWFVGERILIRRLINRRFRVMGSITTVEFVNKKDIYVIKSNKKEANQYYLLAIINSKLVSYLKTTGSTSATKDDFSQLTLNDLREIPIKLIPKKLQQPYILKVNTILEKTKEILVKKNKFLSRLKANLKIDKISTKLDVFYDYDFITFVGELKKQKINLSLSQQDEWEDYFSSSKTDINNLQYVSNKADKEIDQMVYELYGLTEEEIKIVEE